MPHSTPELTSPDGLDTVTVFHNGYNNTMYVLTWIKTQPEFPVEQEIASGGCSAGSIAVQAWANVLVSQYGVDKLIPDSYIGYMLWFTSGIFGLHHVYLGRIDRAITYVLSFGGFGLLALTDMFCIPTKYVREYDALNDIEYIETIKVQQKYNKKPKLSKVLPILLQLYVGSLLGILCGCVIPEELYSDKIYYLLQAIGLSIGIYIAGTSQCNTSFISSSFTNVIASCIIVKMFVMFILAPYTNFIRMNDTSLCWIAGVIAFRYSAYWNIDLLESVASNNETHEKRKIKQQQNQKGMSFLKRLLQYIIIINLIITCVISGIYNYGTVQILNAHTNQYELHKVKDAFHNMIKSQGFKDFKRTFNKFYNDFKTNHDYKESWEKLKEDFDPDGEKRALRILELNDNDDDNLTQQEIKSAYKRLALMYHPDRYQQQQQNNNGDNNYNQYCDQNCAQEKFIEIQEAYEILSKKKSYSSR